MKLISQWLLNPELSTAVVFPVLLVSILLLLLALLRRQARLGELAEQLKERERARERGSHEARLQYPYVDLSRCFGCGACIEACPEQGVLDLIHGQAAVVHGARCVGHGHCAEACPVDAIVVTLGDITERDDIPALTEQNEVVGQPGLFLAGEVTGYALIRTAITHGTAIADRVAERIQDAKRSPGVLNLCIVGAGPAGLSCTLQAMERGLTVKLLEQETLGGAVSRYPRKKLVMTHPVELPGYGKLKKSSYEKEELMEIWTSVAEERAIPIETGVEFQTATRRADGVFEVTTNKGVVEASSVCLALGRRGTPRKLGVPGEDRVKVNYALLDAGSYVDENVLVVGGGDSAVEAALALAEQPGNTVHLSYRRAAFSRIKLRNEERLGRAVAEDRIQVVYESEVDSIDDDAVTLRVSSSDGDAGMHRIPNDHVFIMAGGIPPFDQLKQSGVSFDAEDHGAMPDLVDRGTGLIRALFGAAVLVAMAWAWVWHFKDYYFLSETLRVESELHRLLRPAGKVGLGLGIGAVALVVWNLSYLLKRARIGRWLPGSMRGWMTSHVVTGMFALMLVYLHAGIQLGSTVGGHAFLAMAFLVVTGLIGRYFYSFVPRAANGREMELEEVTRQITQQTEEWDRYGREFSSGVREEIRELVEAGRWNSGFFGRLAALLRAQRAARGVFSRLRERSRKEGLSLNQINRLVALARKAYRSSLVLAHYQDLRALMASWRFFHRWVALLMVLLTAVHIGYAMKYARLFE